MKLIFNKIFVVVLLAGIFSSCKKDEEKAYLTPTGSMTLTSNQTTIVLLEANAANPAVTFGWNKADFGFKAAIGYTLQLCKTGTNWAVPATTNNIDMGQLLAKSYTIGQFNQELLNFLPAFTANDIDIRIKASVGDNVAPQYSNTVKIRVTPYRQIIIYSFPKALNVAGAFQGWDPGIAPQLVDPFGTAAGGNYEGYINFTTATPSTAPEFKLVKGNAWAAGDMGMIGNPTVGGAPNYTIDGVLNPNAGNNILFPTNANLGSGIYLMRANRTSNTFSATKIKGWAVIGSATPNGWGVETPMTYDPITKLYSITLNLSGGNEIKFRANNDWNINFGLNSGKLDYGGPNIPIALSGSYTLVLDLLIAGNYDYLIKKN